MMNKHWKRLPTVAGSLVASFWIAGCGADNGPEGAALHAADAASKQGKSTLASHATVSGARLGDIELRHFAAYANYVVAADTAAGSSRTGAARPASEISQASVFAYLACPDADM